jgi:NADH-quinone oxidoreductase subunit N
LAGFIGKFYLFAAVIREQFYYLALVGILNSVVSLYYYVRVVKTMFLDTPVGTEGEVTLDPHNGSLLAVLSVATVILGVYWVPLFDFADRSARFFVGSS